MIKTESLFKKEKRSDNILPLVEEMKKLSDVQEYENAKKILDKIKEELQKPASDIWPYSYVPLGDIQTIKDVYDLIVSTPIRLDPKNYNFSEFLNLVIAVHNRKDELRGLKYSDTDRQRKVIAQEMIKLRIVIPSRKGKGVVTPNRRFLDIAYDINPDICSKELARRESVKLWKAVEGGNKEKIERARNGVGKYSNRERIYWKKEFIERKNLLKKNVGIE